MGSPHHVGAAAPGQATPTSDEALALAGAEGFKVQAQVVSLDCASELIASATGDADSLVADHSWLTKKYMLHVAAGLHPKMTKAAHAVLTALIERFNEQKNAAWPSLLCLADDTGMRQFSVQRALAVLVGLGMVEVIQKGTRTSANVYRPRWDKGCRMELRRRRDTPDAPEEGRHSSVPTGRHSSVPTGRHRNAIQVGTDRCLEPVPMNPSGVHGGGTLHSAGGAPAGAPGPVPAPCLAVAAAWRRLQEARPNLDFAGIAEAAQVNYIGAGLAPAALDLALDKLRVTAQFRHLPTPPRNAPRVRQQAAEGRKGTVKAQTASGMSSATAKSTRAHTDGPAPTSDQCRNVRVRARALCFSDATKKDATNALLQVFGHADAGNKWLSAGNAPMTGELYARVLDVVERIESGSRKAR